MLNKISEWTMCASEFDKASWIDLARYPSIPFQVREPSSRLVKIVVFTLAISQVVDSGLSRGILFALPGLSSL